MIGEQQQQLSRSRAENFNHSWGVGSRARVYLEELSLPIIYHSTKYKFTSITACQETAINQTHRKA